MVRKLFITEDITATSGDGVKDNSLIKNIVEGISSLDNCKKEPIHVFLDTDGGNIKTALSIYDLLRACNAPIHTYAMSEVSSAGVLIYLAGKKRYAFKHTEFMTHPSSLSITANSLEIQETLNMLLEQGKKVERIFKNRLSMGKKKFNSLHSSTTWIDSIYAKKLRIVTDIIDKIPLELLSEEQEKLEIEGMLVDTLADKIIEKIKEDRSDD